MDYTSCDTARDPFAHRPRIAVLKLQPPVLQEHTIDHGWNGICRIYSTLPTTFN